MIVSEIMTNWKLWWEQNLYTENNVHNHFLKKKKEKKKKKKKKKKK